MQIDLRFPVFLPFFQSLSEIPFDMAYTWMVNSVVASAAMTNEYSDKTNDKPILKVNREREVNQF